MGIKVALTTIVVKADPKNVVPHEGITAPSIAFSDAIRNAYCYELISLALQPDYNSGRFRQNPQCLPLSMVEG